MVQKARLTAMSRCDLNLFRIVVVLDICGIIRSYCVVIGFREKLQKRGVKRYEWYVHRRWIRLPGVPDPEHLLDQGTRGAS